MNTRQGKCEASSSDSLSAKALEYYRMYATTEELPKYFCGSYNLSHHLDAPSIPHTPNIPEIIVEDCEPTASPTSSITSTRKLEWDSGADIGYANYDSKRFIQKSSSMPILQRNDARQLTASDKDIRSTRVQSGIAPKSPNMDVQSKHRELMTFLRTKVGRPRAESTPLGVADLHKADSDPEIYTFRTPKAKPRVKRKRFNTITFHYQIPPESAEGTPPKQDIPSPKTDSTLPSTLEESSDLKVASQEENEDEESAIIYLNTHTHNLQNKTYFTRYQQRKMDNLKVSTAVNIECIDHHLRPDCDAETQTTMLREQLLKKEGYKDMALAHGGNSVAVQTSACISNQEILYLFHPSVQSDGKTSSTSNTLSRSVGDQVFSNCDSFEYVSGRETEKAPKKSISSSTSESVASKDHEGAKKLLQMMQRIVNSKKYNEKEKESFIKKLATKMLDQGAARSSGTSVESERIIAQVNGPAGDNSTAPNTDCSSVNSSNLNTGKGKDWKSAENETNSEKIFSSLESSDSPREALINYAKMERENQLHWISNEMEHLRKLRALLESKKTKKHLRTKTSLPSENVPQFKKSTAVYLITTEKNLAGGDCNSNCAPTVIKAADGVIDFHVHNALGSRDYQFKEIVTKITPEASANPTTCPFQNHEHVPPSSTHPLPSSHPDNPRSCVSEPCLKPTSRPARECCGCHHYCGRCPDACQRVATNCNSENMRHKRDIYPVQTKEASGLRSRSTSPRSDTEEIGHSTVAQKHLRPMRPQTAPVPKIRPASRENATRLEIDGTGAGAANKGSRSNERDSYYDSRSHYGSSKGTSKSGRHDEPSTSARTPLTYSNNKATYLRGDAYNYSHEKYPENTKNHLKERPANEGTRGSFERHYKDSKEKSLRSGRRLLPFDINGEDQLQSTISPWRTSAEQRYVECKMPTVSSKGMCACPKAARKKCQCNISATEDVALATTDLLPKLREKGVRTDETLIAINSKEVQAEPEMVPEMVGHEERPLSIESALLTTIEHAAVEYKSTASGLNSQLSIGALGVKELDSAVVISNMVIPAAKNSTATVRRIVLEMPVPPVDSKEGRKADSGLGSHSRVSSGVDPNSGAAPPRNELLCACCGRCIQGKNSATPSPQANSPPTSPAAMNTSNTSTRGKHNSGNSAKDLKDMPQEKLYSYYRNNPKALARIRETLRELAVISSRPEQSRIPTRSKLLTNAKKCEKLLCDCCNKHIRRNVRKPVAYLLKFDKPSKMVDGVHRRSSRTLHEIHVSLPWIKTLGNKNSPVNAENKSGGNKQKPETRGKTNELRDYLNRNRPDFLLSAEERRRYLIELAYIREHRYQQYLQVLALTNGIPPQNRDYNDEKRSLRLFTTKEMKRMTAKIYKNLPEVQQQRHAIKTNQIKRANRLLVNIFNKNLKESVLRGQPSLSTSISVINMS